MFVVLLNFRNLFYYRCFHSNLIYQKLFKIKIYFWNFLLISFFFQLSFIE